MQGVETHRSAQSDYISFTLLLLATSRINLGSEVAVVVVILNGLLLVIPSNLAVNSFTLHPIV